MAENQLKILMVSSETVPFAKSGGLADVITALSVELASLGHDVRIVMPRYYFIDKNNLSKITTPLGVPISFGEEWSAVYQSTLPGSTVPVYFIDNEQLFGKDGIYGNREEPFFHNNARRFTYLSRAAFQLCKMLSWTPQIFHAHDWPSALVPVYLNTWERQGMFQESASVFTIHNLGYQGIFAKQDIHLTQLDWFDFHHTGFEFYDKLNFLKAALLNADLLTTVSPTYAKEIQTSTYGFNLQDILKQRGDDLYGILNGVDYTIWDPENDPLLPYPYSETELTGKQKNKAALQKELGLPLDPRKPIIGMISRLAHQKGFGELCGPAHGRLINICQDLDVQFIILGTGEQWCEEELKKLESRLDNLKVHLEFNDHLAHLIEAGSDFFLMPSVYEPCGLNQIYSLRYGTLPIARQTGGLTDTVESYNPENGSGTGFLFQELTPDNIYLSVKKAVVIWHNNQDHIQKMIKKAMGKRYSWEISARHYTAIYRKALLKKKAEK